MIGDRLSSPARHVIVVGSGKGGVGKSTVSLNLAVALAQAGHAAGLLDADLYGPSIPLMVGLTKHRWNEQWTLARAGRQRKLAPVLRHGLKIASAGFILGEDQPMGLQGIAAQSLISQLVRDVAWGELDFLVVDIPPGTSDVQQMIVKTVPTSGAVIVITPQYVAHLDARKAVQMYRQAGVPVLGAIENMGPLRCPHCGQPIEVFPAVPESRSIWAMGVEKLASVPLDPELSRSGDEGVPLVESRPDSPQAAAFREVARKLAAMLGAPGRAS